MGACVSSHHKSASAMKVHVSSRKADNHVAIAPSPVKEKLPIVDGNVPVKPQLPPRQSTDNSLGFGSKDETFFDSQAWLESDCESDFMSVNGEFTPSRSNTPVHHNLPGATPPIQGGGALASDSYKLSVSKPSTSPIKKNKRLSELFSESPRVYFKCDEENAEPADENRVVGSFEAAAVHGGGLKPKRERWVEIVRVHGCLPRVLSSCRPVAPQQREVRRE